MTCELAQPSTLDHDYAAYLKIGLRVLLSAAVQGAISSELLAPLSVAMDANTQDTVLADLIGQMNTLLSGQQTA